MQTYNMQLTGQGANDSVIAQVDLTFLSGRTNLRPLEYIVNGITGGHYQLVALYSNTAAKPAAASDVLSLRWTDSRLFLVLKRLTIFSICTTGYTAAGAQDFSLYKATGFSVAASGGTQVIPVAATGQAVRSTMKKSGLDGSSGVLWVSSGDTLTAGTRTLDTQASGYVQFANPATVGSAQQSDLFNLRDFGEHPMVLTANEGLVIQTPIGNAQAAGVSKYGFQVEWAEVAAY